MPQIQLPLFPAGVTHITALLAFSKQDGRMTSFNGSMPVFVHEEEDVASLRMITAQFCVNGNAKQADIVRAFGVTKINLKRAVKRYRQEGPKGFYVPPKRRGPAVLTPPVLAAAQQLLDEGLETPQVADRLGIKRDTLRKAVGAGRLHKTVKKRCRADHQERALERRPHGPHGRGGGGRGGPFGRQRRRARRGGPGLYCGAGRAQRWPALCHAGLARRRSARRGERHLQLPKGYYGLDSLLLLLAFMALARMESIEALRYSASGEWGNLLGLDRVPEVRTLRAKITVLAQAEARSMSVG